MNSVDTIALKLSKVFMDKTTALLDLAIKRKQTEPRPGSTRISDYQHGIYECDYVSPFTKGACKVNADIFLLLQDWSSHNDMSKPVINLERQRLELKYGYTPNQLTNIKLTELLKTYFSVEISDTYGTNLYPYIKSDDMSSSILREDLVWAAEQFALPQIKIVEPKLVICFGKGTFNAIRTACDEKEVDTVEEGINAFFPFHNSMVWLQAHPGFYGQQSRNRGGVDKVSPDWEKMAECFHSLP